MIKIRSSLVPVAHTCNTSYSGGRDQEDHGLKAAQANSLQNPSQKRTVGATQGVGSEFKPQYWKKKKSGLQELQVWLKWWNPCLASARY
jgi:hypothetical protein